MTAYLNGKKVCPTRTINSGGERYLIQASDESMLPDWYRIYSDGWCEQGGNATIESGEIDTEVYFLFEYTTKNYPVKITPRNGLGSVIVSPVGAWTNETSIEIYSNPAGNDRPFSWETKGFIDLSQLEENE